jgi:N-carbamoylputrescine amidase
VVPTSKISLLLKDEIAVKITICEHPDSTAESAAAWAGLRIILDSASTDLLVLPELAGIGSFWTIPKFDMPTWQDSVSRQRKVDAAVASLNARRVVGSRAVDQDGLRLNQAFLWTPHDGLVPGRSKAWFPEQEDAWEATWFHPGRKDIGTVEDRQLSFATLLCTEIMVSGAARSLGKLGVQLIAVPRATGGHHRWETATRMTAISAGAFVVTANRRGGMFQGGSWIVDPDGQEIARTNEKNPVVTVEIDLSLADRAKQTYPRNVEG